MPSKHVASSECRAKLVSLLPLSLLLFICLYFVEFYFVFLGLFCLPFLVGCGAAIGFFCFRFLSSCRFFLLFRYFSGFVSVLIYFSFSWKSVENPDYFQPHLAFMWWGINRSFPITSFLTAKFSVFSPFLLNFSIARLHSTGACPPNPPGNRRTSKCLSGSEAVGWCPPAGLFPFSFSLFSPFNGLMVSAAANLSIYFL